MAVDIHWIALSLLRNVGSKTLFALTEQFGSAEAVLSADVDALLQVRGIGQKTAEAIHAINISTLQQEMQRWALTEITVITSGMPDYPPTLAESGDGPPTLFIRGQLQHMDWHKTTAIVGTRQPTQVAVDTAYRIAASLAADGWTIISGLALGIDSAAHQGALNAANGQTLAVLGSGVLNIYPPENAGLADSIVRRGALIGENHPQATANASRLVSRNRIISGLARHLIVIETSIDGGAMYAARSAQRQGRKLHVVGLPADGNLQLLKEKAHYINPEAAHIILD